MKEFISWFKVLHSEGETRKGKLFINYSKSAWEYQYGQPDYIKILPQAKWLFWKCFHFLPFRHGFCLSQTIPPPVPSCSSVRIHQNYWELQMRLAQVLHPERSVGNQPAWLVIDLPSTFLSHPWSVNVIDILYNSLCGGGGGFMAR